jgi:hypothetical protein
LNEMEAATLRSFGAQDKHTLWPLPPSRLEDDEEDAWQ